MRLHPSLTRARAKTLGVILLASLIGCTTTYEITPDQLPGASPVSGYGGTPGWENGRAGARAVPTRDGSTARLDAYTMVRFHLRDGTSSPWVRASEILGGGSTFRMRALSSPRK